jgi:hypothetical protein
VGQRGHSKAGDCNFCKGKERKIINCEQDFVYHRIKATLKKVEYPPRSW